ncbi:oligomeric Golgi complex subunit 6 [Radiomyces spectabilis]|uniref:oligomeric Golgi complex subunit 6 n=1 Tax=Radiomyces spectabilis TaxID=64574 RepID=UPI002220FB47|nr:oligomeric Golgi complex subunit 6 [Radiomyces spectabilis]KAI8376403.1 oligomeric Golgi complex subunit 6 [Radiomyces spectabilis]
MEQDEAKLSSIPEPLPVFISNKPNKPLAAKLNKVLGSSVSDDARTKAAVTALSAISGLDKVDLQRNLRGTIERKEIIANRKFLDALEMVVKQAGVLEDQVDDMENICEQMQQRLDEAGGKTDLMVEQAKNLQDQSSACATRILIVDRFLEKFTLSESEISTLCSSSVPISGDFFKALKHLQQIHSDCKLLLMTTNQQAGQQIMEKMAAYQETAYDKLYRWTQYESRGSFGGDAIIVDTLMVKALQALRQRPVLFQTIMDELAVARRDAVARAFINALTRGGPGGTPRPIELQAHDSMRYIGDMLAWVHQACAGEKEMLESLFHPSPERGSPNELDGVTSVHQIDEAIADLLDCAMEGTCRPLKTRMEQVLVLQPGAIISYRMANLIQFYAVTMKKLLRKDSYLARTLYEITEMAYKYFFKILSGQAERLLQSTEPPTKELAISPTVRDITLQLKEILASYDSSLVVATNNTGDFPDFEIGETLDATIDPLLRMCEMSVLKFDKLDQDIYRVNCMQHILSALSAYPATAKKQGSLTEQIQELLGEISDEEYQELLQQSGLDKVDAALKKKDADTPLSSVPGMDAQSLSSIMSQLDSYLMVKGADIPPQLRRLSATQHCRQVHDGAIRQLINTYRIINDAIRDPNNNYPHPELVLKRTVEDMNTIFSFSL